MDALIFAAGFGTRLGEFGRETPKALVTVGGRTMLEHVAARLVSAGVDRIVMNVHHHADLIARWVESHDLGAEVILSFEPDHPLETGGGLLNARPLLRQDAPFFMHNVDVLCGADLVALARAHSGSEALVTLAVSERPSQRRLLFDEIGLYGRREVASGKLTEVRKPVGKVRDAPFAGIHVASPELPARIVETGVFGIIELYMRLAGEGERVAAHDLGDVPWFDVGTSERLEEARQLMEDGG